MPLFQRKRTFIKAIELGDIKTVKHYIAEFRAKGTLHEELHRSLPPWSVSIPFYCVSGHLSSDFAMTILLLDAGVKPNHSSLSLLNPFEFAIGIPDSEAMIVLLLLYEQDYENVLCSNGLTMLQKLQIYEFRRPGLMRLFAKTAEDFRNAKQWLLEAENLATSGDLEAAANKHMEVASIYPKYVKHFKARFSFGDLRPLQQLLEGKYHNCLKEASSLYQKLLKNDIDCLTDATKAKQSTLLEKLADLAISLGDPEQAINYSRRSAYLKCGYVAPRVASSITLAASEDTDRVTNPLLPFHANLRRRHTFRCNEKSDIGQIHQ